MIDYENLKNFDELAEAVNNLEFRLIERVCEQEDFEGRLVKSKPDDMLIELLYLLVKHEKFEHAAKVRNEMVKRGLNPKGDSKYEEAEKIINNHINGGK